MHFKVHPKVVPPVRIGDFDVISTTVEHYTTQAETHEKNKAAALSQRYRQHSQFVSLSGERSVELPRVLDDRSVYYHRQFGVKTTIHNYTNRPLLVLERIGLPVVIQPERRLSGHSDPCVIIRVERHFDSDSTCRSAYDLINKMGTIHGGEVKSIQPLLIRNAGQYRFGRKIAIEYRLSEADLDNPTQTLYHQSTDLLLSFMVDDVGVTHPYSPQHCDPIVFDDKVYDGGNKDLRVVIRYFTGNPNATPLYIRIANKTFAIEPEEASMPRLIDVSKRDKEEPSRYEEVSEYVEVFYPTRCEIKGAPTAGYRCSRISLEQARDYYGIHATAEEATNVMSTAEGRIRMLKEQLELAKAESARKLQAQQVEIDELKATNGSIKREFEQAKKENELAVEDLKLKRENQTHSQRMNLESFKFTATVATSILALAPLIVKLYQSQSKQGQ